MLWTCHQEGDFLKEEEGRGGHVTRDSFSASGFLCR